MTEGTANPRGSIWHRWEPHTHTPDTKLNDQFGGADPWNEFLERIETTDPPIRALGVTDYLSLDTYERVLAEKANGRLDKVDLLFPNIELRFAVTATDGRPVNAHLLVSPESDDHVELAKSFLLNLTFNYHGEDYRCSRGDLIRLGKAVEPTASNDEYALRVGVNQFKVDPDQLIKRLQTSAWAQENIRVAVAGSSKDGTASLQTDSSLAALRTKLEALADIIFASSPKQREFWLGDGAASREVLREKWGGCKPCLHGADGHDHDGTGKPEGDRYSWVKGDLTFESLRQACIEPEGRAWVGDSPPTFAGASNLIDRLAITGSDWLEQSEFLLNPGLVAVIGPRGSGKTAFVEMLAAGTTSTPEEIGSSSFLRRAREHLSVEHAEVRWEDGELTGSDLAEFCQNGWAENRVQYLSQQFVEQLCSGDGLAGGLVHEIERVVFAAHSFDARLGAADFDELRAKMAYRARSARQRSTNDLDDVTDSIHEQQSLAASAPRLKLQKSAKESELARDRADRQRLVGKGQVQRSARYDEITRAFEEVSKRIDAAARREQSILALQDEVEAQRDRVNPAALRRLQADYGSADLTPEQWKAFLLVHKGDVDQVLREALESTRKVLIHLRGPRTGDPADPGVEGPPSDSVVPADSALNELSLHTLALERRRLEALIGTDRRNRQRYDALSQKVSVSEAEIAKLAERIEKAEAAKGEISKLAEIRKAAYAGVVQGLIDEEQALRALYDPLHKIIEDEEGSLKKLRFVVYRKADVVKWATKGEQLLDLRKLGPFRGQGALLTAAQDALKAVWETGSADEVANAVDQFVRDNDLFLHAPEATDEDSHRTWRAAIGKWLYSVDHVQVVYGVQYDGVNIEQLSPGTRGIVLLLLYLAIDLEDTRPLIIDQPEENLDPKSIYDELVPRFKSSKGRRQIVVVTHNANIVVNADADQVIIASAGPHREAKLPLIGYESGGIENARIRQRVCDILEGGVEAFQERALRLRIPIAQRTSSVMGSEGTRTPTTTS